MDVRQLAAIVAVADHGTFSAAARALYTVQSNVSGHVAKLERELGVLLVDRANGVLTEEGVRVVDRARRVLHDIDDIAADIASLDEDVSGDARIGVIGTTARWLMPQLLGAVERQHPRVHPIVSEGSTTTIVPGVLSGQLNAAIIHLPIDDPELVVEPLFAEDLLLLVHGSHRLAERETMSLEELEEVPLLLPPKGAALRRVLDRAAAGANVTLRAQAEIDGVRLLASLAFDGFGAAIVPATAAPRQLDGDFRRILVPELPRRVVAWVRRRRPAPSAATSAVAAILIEVVALHAHDQPGVHLALDAAPPVRNP
ncbi:MAG TPA: LysR family transcriptional regulator [Ilumatobacter sp.]|nr:LysR family transcriptional regulator [Ilumatobacter sp.]